MRACVDRARARRRDVCRHGLRGWHSFMLGDGGHACDVAFRRAENTVVDQRGGCFQGRAGLAACVSQICTVQIPVQVSVLTAVGTGPGRRGGGRGGATHVQGSTSCQRLRRVTPQCCVCQCGSAGWHPCCSCCHSSSPGRSNAASQYSSGAGAGPARARLHGARSGKEIMGPCCVAGSARQPATSQPAPTAAALSAWEASAAWSPGMTASGPSVLKSKAPSSC